MKLECEIPWGGRLRLLHVGWFPMRVNNRRVYCDPAFALHMHQYHGKLWIGDACLTIEPGDITITPANTQSRYELKQSGEHWCAHFQVVDGTELLGLPLLTRAVDQRPGLTQRLGWLAEIARFKNGGGKRARRAAEALDIGVREMLLWLYFQPQASETSLGARAEAAIKLIVKTLEEHYERNWSAQELSELAGMNATYLARIFREHYNCTIAQFQLRRRIEIAQHLLLSTNLRVKEIGNAVGLPDPQKFNKYFRSVLACSPSDFRLRFHTESRSPRHSS